MTTESFIRIQCVDESQKKNHMASSHHNIHEKDGGILITNTPSHTSVQMYSGKILFSFFIYTKLETSVLILFLFFVYDQMNGRNVYVVTVTKMFNAF